MKRLRACSETVDESGLAFPLTPALSLGARENVRRRVEDDHHSLFAERGRLQCPLLGERFLPDGFSRFDSLNSRRLLSRPSATLSFILNGGENSPDIVRALRPVTRKAFGTFSLSSRRRREERVGERRKSLFGCPSLRLSPRSCLAGRERRSAFEPAVTGQGRGEEASRFMGSVRVRGIMAVAGSSRSIEPSDHPANEGHGGAAALPYPSVVGRTCRSADYYRERAQRCSRLRQATSLKGSSRRKEAPFSGGLKRVSLLTSPATRLIGDAGRQSQQLLRLSALGLGSAFGLRLSTLP